MLDHPNQLTKKFISNLFNREELDLDSFDFEPVGSGQVGDCYRINLNWNDIKDSPTSLIAKCPAEDASSRDTARNLHLYEIEVSFYQHLYNKCSARVPEPYFADYDPKTSDGILLLGICILLNKFLKWMAVPAMKLRWF